MAVGERISIDGSTGEVFRGELPGQWHVAPEAATLLEWARELGIDVAAAAPVETTTAAQAPASAAASVSADDVVRRPGRPRLGHTGAAGRVHTGRFDGSRIARRGIGWPRRSREGRRRCGLSASGKLAAASLFDADRAAVGDERAAAQLDEFHAFDGRMKALVTAWQMREVGGEQTFNDHSDACL